MVQECQEICRMDLRPGAVGRGLVGLRAVAEAEREGVEAYPLYRWTRATIEDPAKKTKYLKSFTLYVHGQEVYGKAEADSLEAELRPLLDQGLITRLAKHDTDPANNPQAPARYRD